MRYEITFPWSVSSADTLAAHLDSVAQGLDDQGGWPRARVGALRITAMLLRQIEPRDVSSLLRELRGSDPQWVAQIAACAEAVDRLVRETAAATPVGAAGEPSADRTTSDQRRRLAARAAAVWEDPSLAGEWLTSAQPFLDGRTPLSAAGTTEGFRRAMRVLEQLEHSLPV